MLTVRIHMHRSIGTYNWDPVVEIEYPSAFQEALARVRGGGKCRYVYLGGAFTEVNQENGLWFFAGGRRVRVSVLFSFPTNTPLFTKVPSTIVLSLVIRKGKEMGN